MRKQLFNLLLCLSILLLGCAQGQDNSTALKTQVDTTLTAEFQQDNSTALKTQVDTTLTAELQKVLRRARQHNVIPEDWGSLTWMASKPLGNVEGLTLGRAIIKPGKTNPRHRHPKSEEVLYLLKGRLNHTLDDKSVTMSAGDVITIAPGVFHNAASIGSEDAVMVVVYSSGTRGFELE